MKKKVKIPVIVGSSVVAAILIAVIVLCCITVHPLKSFMDYSSVRVTASTYSIPDGTLKNKHNDTIKKNLEDTGFTVMHATLEFVGSYGPRFVTEQNEDGETVKKEMTISAARTACAATSNSYKIELEFDKVRTFTVEKTKVKYDRMMMNVKTTDGELRWVTVYLYESQYDGGENNPKVEEYRVTPIQMRMNTSPLYIALGEIAAEYTA